MEEVRPLARPVNRNKRRPKKEITMTYRRRNFLIGWLVFHAGLAGRRRAAGIGAATVGSRGTPRQNEHQRVEARPSDAPPWLGKSEALLPGTLTVPVNSTLTELGGLGAALASTPDAVFPGS